MPCDFASCNIPDVNQAFFKWHSGSLQIQHLGVRLCMQVLCVQYVTESYFVCRFRPHRAEAYDGGVVSGDGRGHVDVCGLGLPVGEEAVVVFGVGEVGV